MSTTLLPALSQPVEQGPPDVVAGPMVAAGASTPLSPADNGNGYEGGKKDLEKMASARVFTTMLSVNVRNSGRSLLTNMKELVAYIRKQYGEEISQQILPKIASEEAMRKLCDDVEATSFLGMRFKGLNLERASRVRDKIKCYSYLIAANEHAHQKNLEKEQKLKLRNKPLVRSESKLHYYTKEQVRDLIRERELQVSKNFWVILLQNVDTHGCELIIIGAACYFLMCFTQSCYSNPSPIM
jgi:hypothetical protein